MNAVSTVMSRIRGLSSRERMLLAIGAAALVAFALARWVAFPAFDRYRKARAAIPARRATLARCAAVAQGRGAAEEALAAAAGRLSAREKGLLPGDSPSAAAAALQGVIKPWIGGPDTRLTSVRTLPPVAKGPYSEVAVQADLQTTTEGLAEFLAQVPRHRLLLRVRKLSVSAAVYVLAPANRREALTASVVVAGIMNAAGDRPPGGGKR